MSDRGEGLPVQEFGAAEGLDISPGDLLDELAALFSVECPEPPRGSFTIRQFMARTNTTLDKARYYLRGKVEAGELKKVRFANTDYYVKG